MRVHPFVITAALLLATAPGCPKKGPDMTDNDLCQQFVRHQHRCGQANDYDKPLPATRCGDLMTTLKEVDCPYLWPMAVHFVTSKETEEQKVVTRKKISDEYSQCSQHKGELTPAFTLEREWCGKEWEALEDCLLEETNRLEVISCYATSDNWDYRIKCCKLCETAMTAFRTCFESVPSYSSHQYFNAGGAPVQATGRQDKGATAPSRPAAEGNAVSDFFRSGGAR